jgi:carbamoyl-phosphate synthase large subunit
MRILFTNIGKRGYLLEYAAELNTDDFPLELFASDTTLFTSGFYHCNVEKIITPRVSNDENHYIEELLKKCIDNKIEAIIPLMDYELISLSKNKERFKEKGITILLSDIETIEVCLNKQLSHKFCIKNNINTPISFFKKSDLKNLNFPVMKKKIMGSRSVGNTILKSSSGLDTFIEGEDMIQELVSGDEFTMNILNDLNGNFVHAAFCKKIHRHFGETEKVESLFSDEFMESAKKLSKLFKHIGIMDLDFIIDDNDAPCFIDFNPRFGGLYPAVHLSGFNYMKYIIEACKNGTAHFDSTGKRIALMKGYSLSSFDL